MVMLNKVYSGLALDYKVTLHGNEQFALYVRNDAHNWELYDVYDDPDEAAEDGEELMSQAEAVSDFY